MVILIAIVLGVALGLHYMRSGLFLASMLLVSVVLAALGSVAFAVPVAHMVNADSPYTFVACLVGVFILVFSIVRGCLSLVDPDVDFHPFIERTGGGCAGFLTGLVLVGFISTCVLSAPMVSWLEFAKDDFQQASSLFISPSKVMTQLFPGQEKIEVIRLRQSAGEFAGYKPVAPPETDSTVPQ